MFQNQSSLTFVPINLTSLTNTHSCMQALKHTSGREHKVSVEESFERDVSQILSAQTFVSVSPFTNKSHTLNQQGGSSVDKQLSLCTVPSIGSLRHNPDVLKHCT